MLIPSFLGIVLCMICLAGSTWAWFTAGIQSQPQTMTAANYKITVTVDGETVEGSIELEGGTPYSIKLTAGGSAVNFGGYCVIEGGRTPLYTVSIRPGNSLSFTFIPETTADYTFITKWGEYTGKATIKDGITVAPGQTDENSTPDLPPEQVGETAVYTVQPGDTLWDIARAMGASVEQIIQSNDMEDPDSLKIGQQLRVPAKAPAANPTEQQVPKEPAESRQAPSKDASALGGDPPSSQIPATESQSDKNETLEKTPG